jgi:hypothetical protein
MISSGAFTRDGVKFDRTISLRAAFALLPAPSSRELKDGRLQIIDGQLHAETMGKREVGVLVTDLMAEEAERGLLTYEKLCMCRFGTRTSPRSARVNPFWY